MTSPSACWASNVCLLRYYLCLNRPGPKLRRPWFLCLKNIDPGILPIIQKAVSATCMAPAVPTLGPGVPSSYMSALLTAVPPTAILTLITHIAAPLSLLSALAIVSQWSTTAAHVTMTLLVSKCHFSCHSSCGGSGSIRTVKYADCKAHLEAHTSAQFPLARQQLD